jgi:hypothetical protein
MAGVLSQLLELTMQRMVSSVPLPDLVRKVTTDHSESRLGELREMVESLLNTYGFELDAFTGAAHVMHEDVKWMEREHRRLKVRGPCCSWLDICCFAFTCLLYLVVGICCHEHYAKATR